MVAYARFQAADLPKSVGRDEDGQRLSDGRAGHLCYGPYLSLGPGQYTAGFYLRRALDCEQGEIAIDVCSEQGQRVYAARNVPIPELFASIAGLVHLDFTLDALRHGCELRLHVSAQTRIALTEAVWFRRDFGLRASP